MVTIEGEDEPEDDEQEHEKKVFNSGHNRRFQVLVSQFLDRLDWENLIFV